MLKWKHFYFKPKFPRCMNSFGLNYFPVEPENISAMFSFNDHQERKSFTDLSSRPEPPGRWGRRHLLVEEEKAGQWLRKVLVLKCFLILLVPDGSGCQTDPLDPQSPPGPRSLSSPWTRRPENIQQPLVSGTVWKMKVDSVIFRYLESSLWHLRKINPFKSDV